MKLTTPFQHIYFGAYIIINNKDNVNYRYESAMKSQWRSQGWPQVARVTPQEGHLISSMQFSYFFSFGQ